MLRTQRFAIEKIYVPVKRRKTLNSKTVREIAESMLEVGQQTPILVREDGDRFVPVEGLHRLEACKELGETTIVGYLVRAAAEQPLHRLEIEPLARYVGRLLVFLVDLGESRRLTGGLGPRFARDRLRPRYRAL